MAENKTVQWSRVHDLYSGTANTVASYCGSGNYTYLAGGNTYSNTSSSNTTTHSESSWERGISENFTSQNTITKNWSFSGISNVAQTTSDSWNQYSQSGSASGYGSMYTSSETESSTSTSTQGNGWTSFSWSWDSGTNTAEDYYNYSASWQESYNGQTATYEAELTITNNVTGTIAAHSASGGGYSYTYYGSGSGSGSGMGSGTGSGSTSSSSWEFHSNGTGCLDTDYNELLTYTGFRWSTYVNSTIFPTHPTGSQSWYYGIEAGTGCNTNDYMYGYGIAFLGEVTHVANVPNVASLQIIVSTTLPSIGTDGHSDGDSDGVFLFPEADFSRFSNPDSIIDMAVEIEGPSLSERFLIWCGSVIEASGFSDMTIIHTVLDVVGIIPVFGDAADIVNGFIYAAEGKWSDATLSFASAIPGAGVGVMVAKWGKNSLKAMGASSKVAVKISCAMGTQAAKIPAIATVVAETAQAKEAFAQGDYLSAALSLVGVSAAIRSVGKLPTFCFVADTQVVIAETSASTTQYVNMPTDTNHNGHSDSIASKSNIHEQYAYASISLWSACFLGMMGAGYAFATLHEERKRQRQAHCFATYDPQENAFEDDELPEEMITDQEPLDTSADRAEILAEVISEMDHRPSSVLIPLMRIHPILLPRNLLHDEHHHNKLTNKPPFTHRFHRLLQAICLLIMAFCTYGLFEFFPTSLTKQSDTTLPSTLTTISTEIPSDIQPSVTSSTSTEKRYITKCIQDIIPGDRVLGMNPIVSDTERASFTEPPPEDVFIYTLLLPKENDSLTIVNLLRSQNWLENEETTITKEPDESDETVDIPHVLLELPEMGAVGWAELINISEIETYAKGSGNLVTGTFCHIAQQTIDLHIEDIDPIGCTSNHPFWSVDRQDFVEAGELYEGEQVQLYSGETKRVIQKLARPGPKLVYNIEVFGEHVYHITSNGVLVHNDCVYASRNLDNSFEYIGRTKNFEARQAAHRRMSGRDIKKQLDDLGELSYEEARATEDLLIRHLGLQNLSNKINGMSDASRRSERYADAFKKMTAYFQTHGYPQ